MKQEYTLRSLFEKLSTGVLLVDNKNSFNQLNRQATLQAILSIIGSHLNQDLVAMHMSNGENYLVQTQGDPLGMAMYAQGSTPLFRKLYQKHADTTQIWFADDSAAVSSVTNLHEWWDSLIELRPYEVNVSKCWLVVKLISQHGASAWLPA